MKTAERLLFLLGVGLFAWLLHRIGVSAIAGLLSRVGWGFPLIVAAGAVPLALNTLAWRLTLKPEHRRVGFLPLLSFALAGDAINAVTPAAVVGGDLVRIGLLRRRVPAGAAIGSVSLAATAQFVSQVLFVAAGIPIVAGELVVPSLRRTFFALLGVLGAALLLVVYLGWRGDAFRKARRLLERLGVVPPHREGAGNRWESLDEEIFGALRRRSGDLASAAALYFLGWVSGALEVWIILLFLGMPAGLRRVASIEVLSVLVDALTFFVPARVGTQEGGKYVIFLALGLDPHNGFALGLLRRLRELAWALAGLAIYGRYQRSAGAPPEAVPGARIAPATDRPAAP